MENQLVLLKDPNTKPLDWPMGRILEVFPGSDGLVRVVNVKTSTGNQEPATTSLLPEYVEAPRHLNTALKNERRHQDLGILPEVTLMCHQSNNY
ncbi:hypothetical protein TNCV_378201 [Trichonephila clavipes]|nr:hypothetical protein TNCV_378201 [Trichonephila clavipes]